MSVRSLYLLVILLPLAGFTQSWQEAMQSKQGSIDMHWFTSVPFIYEQNGRMTGVEKDIMEAFVDFAQQRYKVDVTLNWVESKSFNGILEQVKKEGQSPNMIGVSAFSITEERKAFATFSEPYFPDIAVLVSSKGTPIVQNFDDINSFMRDKEAITILGTSYERMLQDIRRQLNIPFTIRYIESDKNILDFISSGDDRFGFIDLPIYLMLIRRGGELTRQNFFTVKGTGYAFMMPLGSDWVEPINEFLNDSNYKEQISDIISGYIGSELYQFMDNIYGQEQISTSILTKEKELQLELIRNANLKLEEEQALKRILIYGIGIAAVFLLVIGYLFISNQRTTRQLRRQNSQIAQQDKEIRQMNDQLLNRNEQLTQLNEERNGLVKILAHDLRAPLSQIIMLTDILSDTKSNLNADEKKLLAQIGKGAGQLNQLIAKVLSTDVLEGKPMKVMKAQIDPRLLINEVVARYLSAAQDKQIRIDVKVPEGVRSISSDHLLLTQIIENLLSNALKFSSANTTVTVRAFQEEGKFHFSVEDQGPGFSEEDQALLFQRFQTLSARPTGGESSIGLGLSIVKKYVDDMGAEIKLKANKGQGSTFIVTLP